MIRLTGLASWEFEIPFPGSLTSTFLVTKATPRMRLQGSPAWQSYLLPVNMLVMIGLLFAGNITGLEAAAVWLGLVQRRVGEPLPPLPRGEGEGKRGVAGALTVQGNLAHKKTPTPQGPPLDLRHRPTVGS